MRPMLMRTVGRTLVITEEGRRFVHHELGIRPEYTTVTTLGADPGACRYSAEGRARVRETLGIPEDAVVVVTAGKMTPTKDVHVLLEAMGRLRGRTDRAWLILIGNAPDSYRTRLEAIVSNYALADRIKWLDFLPHDALSDYYSAADIGVWPGDASITYLECAACGVPLVLADCDYNRYAMTNDNGLFFERGDADELADALYRLVSDDEGRRGMGRNARALIERDLNWDRLARQTIEIYQKVIDGTGFD